MKRRTLRLSKLKRVPEYITDDVKLKCFDKQCTVEELQKMLAVETECPWDEYLWEVKYTFTNLEEVPYDIHHTVHYIVRGLTERDRAAFLETMIELDIEEFNFAGINTCCCVYHESECLGKLIP